MSAPETDPRPGPAPEGGAAPGLRLAALPLPLRLGLAAVVLVLLGGLVASAAHLHAHHAPRDQRPGFSLDDLVGAYHGIRTRAPLEVALERRHPEELAPADRDVLLAWLRGGKVAETYDAEALGARAPAEVLARACLECHARNATQGEGIGRTVPLEYWDDVRAVAFGREVLPTDAPLVLASAHTHALGMGSLTAVTILLVLGTRWPRRGLGWLILAAGVGLVLDLATWLPAREAAWLVPVLAASGAAWAMCTGSLILLVLLDLLLPLRRA